MTAKPTYFENDEDSLQREASKADTTSNVPMLYLNPGATVVRILPTWKKGGVYFKEFREHFIRVDGKPYYLTCPGLDSQCPACDEYDRLMALGDDVSLEMASNIDSRPRYLFNVVLLDAPAADTPLVKGEVYVMKTPVTVRSAIVKMDRDEAGGWFNVTSPTEGVNIRITKEGRGLTNTRYHVLPVGLRNDITEYLGSIGIKKTHQDIIEKMFNLDDVFPPRDPVEAKQLVHKASRRTQKPLSRPTTDITVVSPREAPNVATPPPLPPNPDPTYFDDKSVRTIPPRRPLPPDMITKE